MARKKKVIIEGRWTTPKAFPVKTRVRCVHCDVSYELDRDALLLKGFKCGCGKLKIPPRFRRA